MNRGRNVSVGFPEHTLRPDGLALAIEGYLKLNLPEPPTTRSAFDPELPELPGSRREPQPRHLAGSNRDRSWINSHPGHARQTGHPGNTSGRGAEGTVLQPRAPEAAVEETDAPEERKGGWRRWSPSSERDMTRSRRNRPDRRHAAAERQPAAYLQLLPHRPRRLVARLLHPRDRERQLGTLAPNTSFSPPPTS